MPFPAARAARTLAYALAATAACSRPRPAPTVPETRPVGSSGVSVAGGEFTPADTASFLRVRFARGTTSGIVDDRLAAGADRGYILGALQGQVMLAHAIAWPPPDGGEPHDAAVRVYRAHDGEELATPGGLGPLWYGRLPGTGDYVIRVTAPAGQAVEYTLAVQIPRRLVLDREHRSTELAGQTPSRAPVEFLVRGDQGQLLQVALMGHAADAAPTLHLYGLEDGVQLAGLAERRRSWSGPLPSSQDYIVSVVPVEQGTRYELRVGVR